MRGSSKSSRGTHDYLPQDDQIGSFIIMVPEDQSYLDQWCTAVESYTVQSKRIEKVFDFVAKIGQGSFGSVYKA